MASPERVSKTRLAAVLGVTKGRVSQMIALGLPVETDGLVNLASARRWIDENIDRPDRPTSEAYREARLVKMIFAAKLLRLEFERARGRMIESEIVRARVQQHLDLIRAGLAALADRLAGPIALETDAKRVHLLMREAIIAELYRLAAIVGGREEAGAPPVA
jgi:hypothetical protein